MSGSIPGVNPSGSTPSKSVIDNYTTLILSTGIEKVKISVNATNPYSYPIHVQWDVKVGGKQVGTMNTEISSNGSAGVTYGTVTVNGISPGSSRSVVVCANVSSVSNVSNIV